MTIEITQNEALEAISFHALLSDFSDDTKQQADIIAFENFNFNLSAELSEDN